LFQRDPDLKCIVHIVHPEFDRERTIWVATARVDPSMVAKVEMRFLPHVEVVV
jgi:hypothetical protein